MTSLSVTDIEPLGSRIQAADPTSQGSKKLTEYFEVY